SLQRAAGRLAVREQEVCRSAFADHPGTAPFDAYPGLAKAFAHSRQCTRHVFQPDRNILHECAPRTYSWTGVQTTSVVTLFAMKQLSWAAWCMASTSAAVGRLSPLNMAEGARSTRVIAIFPAAFLPILPRGSS